MLPLSTYSTYGQYLKKYQVEIQPALGRLMSNTKRLALDKDMRQLKLKKKHKQDDFCALLIKGSTTGTGFELLNSKDFGDVRLVHNYYESIGYGLTQGQLDFEVIFDLIIVPAYWNIHNPSSDWYLRNEKLTKKDISQTNIKSG
jgi:hypothetical protein